MDILWSILSLFNGNNTSFGGATTCSEFLAGRWSSEMGTDRCSAALFRCKIRGPPQGNSLPEKNSKRAIWWPVFICVCYYGASARCWLTIALHQLYRREGLYLLATLLQKKHNNTTFHPLCLRPGSNLKLPKNSALYVSMQSPSDSSLPATSRATKPPSASCPAISTAAMTRPGASGSLSSTSPRSYPNTKKPSSSSCSHSK